MTRHPLIALTLSTSQIRQFRVYSTRITTLKTHRGSMRSRDTRSPAIQRIPVQTVGVQLIQFGEAQQHSVTQVLQDCARAGVLAVEVNYNYLPTNIDTLAQAMATYGVNVLGLHVAFDDINTPRQRADVAAIAKIVRTQRIICSGIGDGPLTLSLPGSLPIFTAASHDLHARGLRLYYHPYAESFSPFQDSSRVEYIFEHLDRAPLRLAIDTYWCHALLAMSAQTQQRLLARSDLFHLKDGFLDQSGPHRFVPLGQGQVPLHHWLKLIYRLAQRPLTFVIEQDTIVNTPFLDLSASKSFLRTQRIMP